MQFGVFSDAAPTELQLEHPALAACYDAAALGVSVSDERAGQPALRVVSGNAESSSPVDLPDEPAAEVRGINLYRRQRVHGRDRAQLCRYLARPPIANDRLTRMADGRLRYELERTWKDGTRAVVFEPLDLRAEPFRARFKGRLR